MDTKVAYQSNLNNGFRFLQQAWVNNAKCVRFLNRHRGGDDNFAASSSEPQPLQVLILLLDLLALIQLREVERSKVLIPKIQTPHLRWTLVCLLFYLLSLDGHPHILTDFVVSRGGEYFFSPSISAILDTLAA